MPALGRPGGTDGRAHPGRLVLPVLLVLIFLRVPIGLAMLVIGLVGSWQVYGSASPLLNQMKTLAYGQFSTIRCRSCRCSC
jgi:hypothetical protein